MDTAAKADLTSSVLADLRWLRDSDLAVGDEGLLRDLSARLRRLLVDGTLQRYRKQVLQVRGEPRILTMPMPSVGDGVVFAHAGGALRGGVQVAGARLWERALTPEEIKAEYEADLAALQSPRSLQLSSWLSEACLYAGGVKVSRRDVIKFVANKLGGVHVDPKRNPATEPEYVALDRIRSGLQLGGLDGAYHALTSAGQEFRDSPDVCALTP